ncbi:MAG TPA: SRPBCC family protein [Asanoa sp.]
MTFPARHVSVAIDRSPADVYAFAADPANLPRWAAGLTGSIAQVDGRWVAESPMGRIVVRFADPNPYGVLDHDVTTPSGETFHNPLRVLANGDGSEVVFTVYRWPATTDEAHEADAAAVAADLATLKSLLEG